MGSKMTWCRFARTKVLAMVVVLGTAVLPVGGQEVGEPAEHNCGYQTPEEVADAIDAAVRAGQISDPRDRVLPLVFETPRQENIALRGPGVPIVTSADIFAYEDSAGLLLTNFSEGALFNLMSQATNALQVTHGDDFDFVGFFLNFTPNHTLGSAFYLGLENDATGLGQGVFEARASLGIAGNNVEGLIMMWNQASWAPNKTAMLVLGQELEHRWGMFLSGISGGRALQGNNSGCGRSSHWNWKVDGQGSGMEIREWVGTNPAVLGGDCAPGSFFFICNNSDIGTSLSGLGGVFSYPDLYLMGYVSPAEMDANVSELRYMNSSNCSSNYSGLVTTFGSSEIIAANGARSPDSTTSQHDFRTGWIMFHQPGAPPSGGQLNNVVNILNMWSETWFWSTVGLGTMDNTLQLAFSVSFPNGTPDTLTPNQPTPLEVATTNINGQPDTTSGLLHVSVDGGAFQTSALAFLGGNTFEATLPGIDCTSSMSFYVTIDALGGGTITEPASAPATTPRALSAFGTSVGFADDFETGTGWVVNAETTDNATTGIWTRVNPRGTAAQPENDHTDPGTLCFVTGQGTVGGGLGEEDIDGGTTTLFSPIFDASAASTIISYWRWYSNDTGNAPNADTFVIDISNDSGSNWVNAETVGPSGAGTAGGWIFHSFLVSDVIAGTGSMRMRFAASDAAAGSIVEAGLDDFAVTTVNCTLPTPPTVTSAVSRVTHGVVADFDVDLLGPAPIEPRTEGVTKIVVNFDLTMDNSTVTTANVSVVGINSGAYGGSVVAALGGSNDELTLTFDPSLPNVDRYTVDLTGMISAGGGLALANPTFEVITLRGDVDQTGTVTTGDASAVRFFFNQTANGSNFLFDVNNSGGITTGDFAEVRFFFNDTAP